MGIYFVSVTYWKYPSGKSDYRVSASVYRDSTTVLYLYDDWNHYNYVTNNALVRCDTGQYIESVSCVPDCYSSYLYGSGSYPESIFTVMSVHQEGNYTHKLHNKLLIYFCSVPCLVHTKLHKIIW